jgi:Flp pilus assembly protein TadG
MSGIRVVFSHLKAFCASKRANVAIIFGLSLLPITIAAGAGLDLARGMIVREQMLEALDAAGLAAGSASGQGMAAQQIAVLSQTYFNANYKLDSSYGTPKPITLVMGDKVATASTSVVMPTVLVRLGDLIGCTHCDTVTITGSTQVVWGQTKLWVSLVLDNTGSMTQTDNKGVSKISALKTGTTQLLGILQSAAATPGDVQVAILPFSKDVNVGTTNVNASWIDWTDWGSAPPSSTPSSSVGPGSSCPYTWSSKKFACTKGAANDPNCDNSGGNDCVTTIPSTGLICPSQHDTDASTGLGGHYYNGCYNSTKKISGCKSNCQYDHTWVPNSHSTWTGCIMDRSQNYDVQNTAPAGTSTNFPAENAASCPPASVMALNYNWSNLNSKVASMQAQGSTNQTIGLAWGWQAQTSGNPLSPPTLPPNTLQVVVLLSDGLNTQDRFYGDGSNQSTNVDNRMSKVCTNVKAAGYIVYTIFVDLNGTQGNSTVLQNCASDSSKYFDLTQSGQIITTLNVIAQDIVNLRLSK